MKGLDIGLLKFGLVTDNSQKGFVKVKVMEEDDLVTDFLPLCFPFAMGDTAEWQLPINTQVAYLTDCHGDVGVVLGAIYSDVDAPQSSDPNVFQVQFSDGTLLKYDKGAQALTANVQGKVTVVATNDIAATSQTNITASATIKATIQAPDIELVGNVTVTGVISAGGISAAPMPGVAGADGKISAQADITTTGNISASDVKAGSVSLLTHVHGGVQTGGGVTAPPQ